MPIIMGQCKNCGGNIQFDEGTKNGICPFCGTPYIAEDVTNNYHYHNQYNINHANIKLEDSNSIEKKLESAEVYLTSIKNYNQAEKIFKEVSKLSPNNYKCWWGLVRTATKNLSDVTIGDNRFNGLVNYELKNAFTFANGEELEVIKQQWNNYFNNYQKAISILNDRKSQYFLEKNKTKNAIEKKEQEKKSLETQINSLNAKIKQQNNKDSVLILFAAINGIASLELICLSIINKALFLLLLAIFLLGIIIVFAIKNFKSKKNYEANLAETKSQLDKSIKFIEESKNTIESIDKSIGVINNGIDFGITDPDLLSLLN